MQLKPVLIIAFLVSVTGSLPAQTGAGGRYFTRGAAIQFFSDSPLEKIEASTNSGNCVLDLATGKLEAAVLINSFNFKKALMQEHFNENYMESSKFPKAVFKGSLDKPQELTLSKDGTYKTMLKGEMTIHGITRPMQTEVVFRVGDGKIFAETAFDVTVADYGIRIPALMRDNIAKIVRLTVKSELQELKKT
ncbi:MAG TPA: YceI family protein [Saprospiraceae bacterium]|nr:YceI family protein [Saprospiraceae bacterium]HNT22073.1 YceI family protein [Saprospiraceae bacterium]